MEKDCSAHKILRKAQKQKSQNIFFCDINEIKEQ